MRLVALNKDEVPRLLLAAKQHSPRAHAMILLAIRHGLRVSEVTGLRLEHINLKEGWIRVERLKAVSPQYRCWSATPASRCSMSCAFLTGGCGHGGTMAAAFCSSPRTAARCTARPSPDYGGRGGWPAAGQVAPARRQAHDRDPTRPLGRECLPDPAAPRPPVDQLVPGLLHRERSGRERGRSRGLHPGVLIQNAPIPAASVPSRSSDFTV